jgi:hypothetical protein
MSWVNWWNVVGLICAVAGTAGAGLDQFIWTKSAPLNVIPNLPAMTRFGFGLPRRLYDIRHRVYWVLILFGFILQFLGAFR